MPGIMGSTLRRITLTIALGGWIVAGTVPALAQAAEVSWPVGFDARAFEIRLSTAGDPILEIIPTWHPVLEYAGLSTDQRFRAYTTLEALDEEMPLSRRPLLAEELANARETRVVPSGDLYIEPAGGGAPRRVNSAEHYVVAVSWSPRDANRLAYTFSSGSAFGVAVADVLSEQVRVLKAEGLLADYLSWSADGEEVQVFEELPPERLALYGGEPAPPRLRSLSLGVDVGSKLRAGLEWSSSLPMVGRASGELEPFEVRLHTGARFQGASLWGFSELTLIDSEGQARGTFGAHSLEAILPAGVVVRKYGDASDELLYLDGSGQVRSLAALAAVSYVFPFQNLSTTADFTVTQVGASYSTVCNLFSHSGASSYAYDLQSKVGNEHVLAPADGTVAYIHKNVTCNSLDNGSDGTTCADYRASCSDNGHWGNVVILQHADGTWTKHTHLKYGSVVPTTIGRSAAVGCKLATQGHTGWTTGGRNGCGDHLHFARQRSSGRDGISIAISFSVSGVTNPLRCRSYESTTGGRSCVF